MPSDVSERLRGKFIVFDGVDGSGKGAQIERFAKAVREGGVAAVIAKDPGGTAIGDRIRHVLFDYDLSEMDVRCETFLFMASRAQLVREVIGPTLAAKESCLICDRYVSATCAYQGAAGYDPRRTIEVAQFAIGECWPDLTIVLDLPADEGLDRIGTKAKSRRKGKDSHGQIRLFHDTHADAMEARPIEFHRRVREMFRGLPEYYPRPVAIIDAVGDVEEVHARVMEAVRNAAL